LQRERVHEPEYQLRTDFAAVRFDFNAYHYRDSDGERREFSRAFQWRNSAGHRSQQYRAGADIRPGEDGRLRNVGRPPQPEYSGGWSDGDVYRAIDSASRLHIGHYNFVLGTSCCVFVQSQHEPCESDKREWKLRDAERPYDASPSHHTGCEHLHTKFLCDLADDSRNSAGGCRR
jgi:hypothetical protein